MSPRWEHFADRFWAKVTKTDGCWLWSGSCDPHGYGQFSFNGRPRKAHRVAWFLVTGAWPLDKLLHRCDNPPCVRPDHLFEGSQTDNMRDAATKGRVRGVFGPGNPGKPRPWRLTPDQEIEVRERLAAGGRQRDLAVEYGVSQMTISRISRRNR